MTVYHKTILQVFRYIEVHEQVKLDNHLMVRLYTKILSV